MATSREEGRKNVRKRVGSNFGHLCNPGWLQSLENILPCRWKKSRSYKVDIIRSATFYLKWLQIGDFYLSKGLQVEACSINADELEELSKGCGGIGKIKKKGCRRRRMLSKAVKNSPSTNEVTSSGVTEGLIQPLPALSSDKKLSAVINLPKCMPADPMWSYSSSVNAIHGRDTQASSSGCQGEVQDGKKTVAFNVYDESHPVSIASPSVVSSTLVSTAVGPSNTLCISSQSESPLKSVMTMDLFPSQHFHNNNLNSPVHAQTYQWIARTPALSPWQTLSPTAAYPDNFLSTCRTLATNNVHETPSYHQPAYGQGWTFGNHEMAYLPTINQGIPVTLVPDSHGMTVYQPSYNQGWTNGANLYDNGSYHNMDSRQEWNSDVDVHEKGSHVPTQNQEWTLPTDNHGNALNYSHYGQGWTRSKVVQVESNGLLNTGMLSYEDRVAKAHGQGTLQNEKIKVRRVKIASKQANLNPFITMSRNSDICTENIYGSQQLIQGEDKENLGELTVERVRYNKSQIADVDMTPSQQLIQDEDKENLSELTVERVRYNKAQIADVNKVMPSQIENVRRPLAAINI